MEKDIKKIKAAAKQFYDHHKKYFCKLQKTNVEVTPGLMVTVSYHIDPHFGIDRDGIICKVSKELKKSLDDLNIDLYDVVWDIDFSEKIDTSSIVIEDNNLKNVLNKVVFNSIDVFDFGDLINSDTNLVEFYEIVLDLLDEGVHKPKSVTVAVSQNYTGIVAKDVEYVQVGCQRVPIENIKAILKAYEEVNS